MKETHLGRAVLSEARKGGDVLGDRAGLFWALFVWGCIYQFQTVLSEQNCTNFLARAGEYSFENLKPLQLFCVFRILAPITLSIPDGCVKKTPPNVVILNNNSLVLVLLYFLFSQQGCNCGKRL